MSRSKKKNAWVWISKTWTKFHERAFRTKMKRALHDVEINWNPDRDWEEANEEHKKSGIGDWGTRCGFSVEPSPDDTWFDDYGEMLRK